jgi:RNA polymerase sigma-70 factor (ECF subfamily)
MASERGETADALVLRDLAWAKDLARRLLGDPELAEDVAHDAWLAARTRPPAQLTGGVRAWLGTVVQHGVQRLRRSERRRRTREAAVAAAAATDSAADVVERGALCRELTGVVMELDEPYRSAILLRYLDGLSTAEVAARQQVAPAAARKRLSRALQLLRERLDRTHAGGFAAWGLAWRSQFGLAPAATASGVVGASVWLMNGKLLLASIAAVAAMFLLWQWWPRPETTVPGVPRVDAAAPASGGTGTSPSASSSDRVAAADAAAVEVVDASGVPRPQVHVFALTEGALVQAARTDAAGRVVLHARSTDELLVAEPGVVPMRLRREVGATQRVVFPRGEVVAGQVQLPPGFHGPVVLRLEHDRRGSWSQGLDERVLDQLAALGSDDAALRVDLADDGTFRFAGLAGDWTGALTTDGAWTLHEPSGRGSRDDATTLLLLQPAHDLRLLLTAPFVVRGRLLAGEAPAAGLTVHVVVPELRQDGGLRTAQSGDDGRFAIGVPRPIRGGTFRGELLVGSATGDNLLQRRIEAAADEAVVDVGDLGVGRALAFVVRGADGAPLAGAAVRVVAGSGVFVAADTDAAGRASVFGVPPGVDEATVRAHGHHTAVVPLPEHGDVDVQLVAGNGIDVQVVDRDGAAAGDVRVRVEADRLPFVLPGQPEPAPRPFALLFPLDAEGRCELLDLVPGVLLRLVAVDELDQEVGRAEVVAPPTARCDAVTIRVVARTFTCPGRVVDERGRPVPRVRLHAEHAGQALSATTDADGRFALGPLRTARTGVHMEANHPAFVPWLRDGVELGPETVFDLVLVRGRTLRAHLRQSSGAPVAGGEAWLVFDDAAACFGRTVADGERVFERAAAQPGRLVVRLGGRELSQPIDGVATDVDVVLPELGTVSITYAPESDLAGNERVCVVVTPIEPAGEVDRRYLPREIDPGAPAWMLQLLPGRYRLVLEARRLGGGGARVRELGTPRELDVPGGGVLPLVLP